MTSQFNQWPIYSIRGLCIQSVAYVFNQWPMCMHGYLPYHNGIVNNIKYTNLFWINVTDFREFSLSVHFSLATSNTEMYLDMQSLCLYEEHFHNGWEIAWKNVVFLELNLLQSECSDDVITAPIAPSTFPNLLYNYSKIIFYASWEARKL